ncbi:hypothetical protein SAMN05216268_105165 [Streptomyces yunnanensis]|uniref:Uncharacterized protein n=1 Tax=Streptomyces yunnanensis TaxID=156453 RepID=A0A9X8QRN3_9ACTN|nr:hypothetical protein SAMN05216268_105165 [Streptomyces yunnanensis]
MLRWRAYGRSHVGPLRGRRRGGTAAGGSCRADDGKRGRPEPGVDSDRPRGAHKARKTDLIHQPRRRKAFRMKCTIIQISRITMTMITTMITIRKMPSFLKKPIFFFGLSWDVKAACCVTWW